MAKPGGLMRIAWYCTVHGLAIAILGVYATHVMYRSIIAPSLISHQTLIQTP